MWQVCCFALLGCILAQEEPAFSVCPLDPDRNAEAAALLLSYNEDAQGLYASKYAAEVTYHLDPTDSNKEAFDKATSELENFKDEQALMLSDKFPRDAFCSLEPQNQRQLLLTQRYVKRLSAEKKAQLAGQISSMQTAVKEAKYCAIEKPNCTDKTQTKADATEALNTLDYDKREHAFYSYADAVGSEALGFFENYVQLVTEAANNAYAGSYKIAFTEPFEITDPVNTAKALYAEVLPLYDYIHAFARQGILKTPEYEGRVSEEDPFIAAHLIGGVEARDFSGLAVLKERQSRSEIVTNSLNEQGYTPKKIFEKIEEYFTAMGFEPLNEKFWSESVFEKPANSSMLCQSGVFDMSNGKDYLYKSCGSVNERQLYTSTLYSTVLHYFSSYLEQPALYREKTNALLRNSIARMFATMVTEHRGLKDWGLLPDDYQKWEHVDEVTKIAMEQIPLLTYALIIDLWRFKVFDAAAAGTDIDYNKEWQEFRETYQGIKYTRAPAMPSIHPALRFHVTYDTPYIDTFFGFVLQFQLREAFCEQTGQTIGDCDLGRLVKNKDIGEKLRSVMSKGAELPFEDLLFELIGTRELSARPLLKFMEPLLARFKNETQKQLDAEISSLTCFGWGSEMDLGRLATLQGDKIKINRGGLEQEVVLPTPRCA